MHYVIVDLVSDFVGKMRRPVQNAFARKCGSSLGADKRRANGGSKNQSFHLHSLLFNKLDCDSAARIRVHSEKTPHCVALLFR
jgi:hypothetical protein